MTGSSRASIRRSASTCPGKKEGKKEGIEEGKIEGKIEEKTAGIINALKQGKLTPDDIAEIFSTTLDFVLKIKEEHNL